MLMRIMASAAALGMLVAVSTPSYSATPKKPAAERSAKSKECSAEADTKGLHGKPRKRFRSTCMRGKSTT